VRGYRHWIQAAPKPLPAAPLQHSLRSYRVPIQHLTNNERFGSLSKQHDRCDGVRSHDIKSAVRLLDEAGFHLLPGLSSRQLAIKNIGKMNVVLAMFC
jgi:hypothetical protein